jgi:hypothetical protein
MAQPSPARRWLAEGGAGRYVKPQAKSRNENTMFARIARQIETYRHLRKQETAFRDRRIAGVLIAFFGR